MNYIQHHLFRLYNMDQTRNKEEEQNLCGVTLSCPLVLIDQVPPKSCLWKTS